MITTDLDFHHDYVDYDSGREWRIPIMRVHRARRIEHTKCVSARVGRWRAARISTKIETTLAAAVVLFTRPLHISRAFYRRNNMYAHKYT